MAHIASLQKEGGPEYALRSERAQVVGTNREHHLALRLDEGGVHVRRNDKAGSELTLRLKHAGCAERPQAAPISEAIPTANGNCVEMAHAGVTEWYLNGPLGLEQGFTLNRDPKCSDGRLAIDLGVGGRYAATLAAAGKRVDLRDQQGRGTVYYSGLVAFDADGKELPAQLKVVGQTIRLEVAAAGARYPVVVDPQMWTEQQKLIASDGAAGENLGYSVAVSGDTAVIGAPYSANGQAYVYVRAGNSWTQQQKLTASDAAADDHFGYTVAVSGDTLVIGAPDKTVGIAGHQGQAYVYLRSGITWAEQKKLTASDGGDDHNFATSVAVIGDTVVVGAPYATDGLGGTPGEAYVYVRSGTAWTEQQKLIDPAAEDGEEYGTAVAISADTMLISAPSKLVGTNFGQGQVFVYVRSGTTWAEQQKIVSSDGKKDDGFGYGIALSGDTAVVGAPNKTIGTNKYQGQAYVFARSGTSWTEQQKLLASNGIADDAFGAAVAVSGDVAIVGSATDNGQQGFAFAYQRAGTTWTEQMKLTASDGAVNDGFGAVVAFSGNTAVIAAPYIQVGANYGQGAAYVYVSQSVQSPSINGTACAMDGECGSGHCVDGVCCNTACGGGAMDCQSCLKSQTGLLDDGVCWQVTTSAQVTCRPAAGACDVAEMCDGTSPSCPADKRAAAGMVCRAASDASLLDAFCDSTSIECPANMTKSGSQNTGCMLAAPGGAGMNGGGAASWAAIAAVAALLLASRRRNRAPN